jgi:RNA polymerase sigma-70 factor (ECF subfamily)
VLQARGESPEAQAALGELCAAYWQPVFCFLRRDGRDEESARDLTQEFFTRLLTRRGLDTVEPGRGRFRSFLLGAVKHFLADERDRAAAAKRGGGQSTCSIEGLSQGGGTTEWQVPDPGGPPPDAVFDRQWAQTLVARGLDRLAAEFSAGGKADQLEILKPWLLGSCEAFSQADAAQRLGLTEGAVKVAIHRLRKRFRELIKQEISHTVTDPAQIDVELRYLVEVLAA